MRLDLANRRLRVPHSFVIAGVERAVATDPLVTAFDLDVTEEGYLANLTIEGDELTVVVRPTTLRYEAGALTLTAETPRGIRVENRPAAHAVIAALTIVFGGTPRGQKILSPGDIDGLEWNGLQGTWTLPLEGVMASSGLIGSRAHLTLALEHQVEGLWLTLPPGVGIVKPLTALRGLLAKR